MSGRFSVPEALGQLSRAARSPGVLIRWDHRVSVLLPHSTCFAVSLPTCQGRFHNLSSFALHHHSVGEGGPRLRPNRGPERSRELCQVTQRARAGRAGVRVLLCSHRIVVIRAPSLPGTAGLKPLTLESWGHGLGESEVGVDSRTHPCGVVGAPTLVRPERAAGL